MMTQPHTKIIFTAGPACEDATTLKGIIEAGAHICRLNMAHSSHESIRVFLRTLRDVAQDLGKAVAILMDIKGPEVRTGEVAEPITLNRGDRLRIVTYKGSSKYAETSIPSVSVNYPDIIHDVQVGDTLLVDSGLIHLKIVDIKDGAMICEALTPGLLKSRRHINLPGVHIKLPSLTEKDKVDIAFGLEMGVSFFALSFVREAKDVETLRSYLESLGSSAKIISKIEDQCGLKNKDAIIQASDGVMVARGDLGVECPYEELPFIQTQIVQACIRYSKPVIVATHMLESMITAPIPTRAEVSDIAKAVFEAADAIMLSGETTIGQYPVECVKVMSKVAYSTERLGIVGDLPCIELDSNRKKLVRSAAILAKDLGNAPIVVFSTHGHLPTLLSSLRPARSPIFAFTNNLKTYQEMLLLWGVYPFMIDFPDDPEARLQNAMDLLVAQDFLKVQTPIVVVTYINSNAKRYDTIQIRHTESCHYSEI